MPKKVRPIGPGKAWLKSVAKAVAAELALKSSGTVIRVTNVKTGRDSNADGWWYRVGSLGRGQPTLEIWLDRFTKHDGRKLWACLATKDSRKLTSIVKRVAKLVPKREIGPEQVDYTGERLFLKEKLPASEFNRPIRERYYGENYFGVYDRADPKGTARAFVLEAAEFFTAVAKTIPAPNKEDDALEHAYPRHERKKVRSHLRRDRSPMLALACKQRDKYRCQCCRRRMQDIYGDLGKEFAECHHTTPLNKLRDGVLTRLEDLITVCPNCHRMLHRMEGEPADIARLQRLLQKRKRR